MKQFSDLTQLDSRMPALDQQQRADGDFTDVARSHGFTIWKPGDPIPKEGWRVLIGAATYSSPDMALLDDLAAFLSKSASPPALHLFNIRGIHSMDDLNRFVPDIAPAFQTPVVGIWHDGTLVGKASGREGRDLIRSSMQSEPFSNISAVAR